MIKIKKILFVCAGNTCRSPMAEGIFNARASERGLDARAKSCGLYMFGHLPASQFAIKAAKRYGADLSKHRSMMFTEELFLEADFVLCMTRAHMEHLCERYPQYEDRVFMLDNTDIADPFGGDLDDYLHAAEQIASAVDRIVGRLKTRESP